MGGGLLQKLNRDTLSFATKLSHLVRADGAAADIMKAPAADKAKISFPGARNFPYLLSFSFFIADFLMVSYPCQALEGQQCAA